jgi:hypothetical protein
MTKVQRRRRRVGAPAAVVPALKQVVSDARQDGIDLKIVVIGKNPPVDTPLHDIATEVGRAYPGSTALVLSPSYAGTYSPTFDRIGGGARMWPRPATPRRRRRIRQPAVPPDCRNDRRAGAGGNGGDGRHPDPVAARQAGCRGRIPAGSPYQ